MEFSYAAAPFRRGWIAFSSLSYTSKTVSSLVTCSRSPTRCVRLASFIEPPGVVRRGVKRHQRSQPAAIDVADAAQIEHDPVVLAIRFHRVAEQRPILRRTRFDHCNRQWSRLYNRVFSFNCMGASLPAGADPARKPIPWADSSQEGIWRGSDVGGKFRKICKDSPAQTTRAASRPAS